MIRLYNGNLLIVTLNLISIFRSAKIQSGTTLLELISFTYAYLYNVTGGR